MMRLLEELARRRLPGPVLIGATGGSGTRVFARIVREAGLFIGTELNVSEDAVALGGYSDRWINSFIHFRGRHFPDSLRDEMWKDLESVLIRHLQPLRGDRNRWGWKEPRCIYLLPFFHSFFPDLRFLHVVRDGRDIAFSANQNQLNKHGSALQSYSEHDLPQHVRSILLWSRINMLAARYGSEALGANYFRVRFEDLCETPVEVIQRVLDFLECNAAANSFEHHVQAPSSLGRWRDHDEETVSQLEVHAGSALEELGYPL